jgi:ribosome-associated protein
MADSLRPISAEALDHAGEIKFEFFRSPGPGGQNVNEVSTGVRIRWDFRASKALPGEVIDRLRQTAGRRVTDAGILVIEARRYRTQEKNRQEALSRLDALIRKAWDPPKPRRPTRPTKASKERRLQEKKQRGELKKGRGGVEDQTN